MVVAGMPVVVEACAADQPVSEEARRDSAEVPSAAAVEARLGSVEAQGSVGE